MKKDIHPNYVESTIACACGEVFQTRSTRKEIRVGVCAKCHPFFTGTQKYLDTAGRVEKFMKKYAAAKSPKKKKVRTLKDEVKAAPVKKAKAAAPAPESAPVTETQAPEAQA
jgi:large subunit ribosomal protein L31